MVNAQADALGRISTLGGPLRESVGTSSRVAGKPTDKAGDQHRPPYAAQCVGVVGQCDEAWQLRQYLSAKAASMSMGLLK